MLNFAHTAEIREFWYSWKNIPKSILRVILSHYPVLDADNYLNQIKRVVVDDTCISFYVGNKIFFCSNKLSSIPRDFSEQIQKILNPKILDIREAIQIYISEIEWKDVPKRENIQIINYDEKQWDIIYDISSTQRKSLNIKLLIKHLWEGIHLINTEAWFISKIV